MTDTAAFMLSHIAMHRQLHHALADAIPVMVQALSKEIDTEEQMVRPCGSSSSVVTLRGSWSMPQAARAAAWCRDDEPRAAGPHCCTGALAGLAKHGGPTLLCT